MANMLENSFRFFSTSPIRKYSGEKQCSTDCHYSRKPFVRYSLVFILIWDSWYFWGFSASAFQAFGLLTSFAFGPSKISLDFFVISPLWSQNMTQKLVLRTNQFLIRPARQTCCLEESSPQKKTTIHPTCSEKLFVCSQRYLGATNRKFTNNILQNLSYLQNTAWRVEFLSCQNYLLYENVETRTIYLQSNLSYRRYF